MIVRARALEADPALAGFALAFGRLTLAKVADWIVHGAAPWDEDTRRSQSMRVGKLKARSLARKESSCEHTERDPAAS